MCLCAVVGDNLDAAELRALVRRMASELAELRGEVGLLRAANARLTVENERLKVELAETRAQLTAARKNSSNSSKPPSSDIVKPPPHSGRRSRSKRRIGGQAGHPRHERPPFGPEQIDRVHTHALNACPDCGGRLRHLKGQDRVIQQAEIVAQPLHIEEHRSQTYCCRRCGKTQRAPLPASVKAGGLLGPGLTSVVAYLKGACHTSFSTIRKFFRDVLGLTLSRGYLATIIRKVSDALAVAYDDLRARLPGQRRVNSDETGHRENGKRPWTWCFRAPDYSLFKIADSRGSDVLREMLGDAFGGVLGCDYFSAYRKYMKDCDVRVQFCMAHLIRELKFMATLPDEPTAVYAESLLLALGDLFKVIHRRERMSPAGFVRALERRRGTIFNLATYRVPNTAEARNLAERFRIHGPAYFEFISSDGIDPTNNLAEQAIRFVVIDRLITQGTRSEAGRRWCERIWTVLATCAQQGRSAFDFIHAAVNALFQHRPAPPILANTS
jgi:transposase